MARRRVRGAPFASAPLPRAIGPMALGTMSSAALIESGEWAFAVGKYGPTPPFTVDAARSGSMTDRHLSSLHLSEPEGLNLPSVEEQISYLDRKYPGLYVPEDLLRDLISEASTATPVSSSGAGSLGCAMALLSLEDGTTRIFAASGIDKPLLCGYTLQRGEGGRPHLSTDVEIPCWSPVRQLSVDARRPDRRQLVLRQPSRLAFMDASAPSLDDRLAMTTDFSDTAAGAASAGEGPSSLLQQSLPPVRGRGGHRSVVFDREIVDFALNPFLSDEVAVLCAGGTLTRVTERESTHAIVEHRRLVDPANTAVVVGGACDYSWHPRVVLCGLDTSLVSVDVRAPPDTASGPVFALADTVTSVRAAPTRRFEFVTASASAISLFDARYARRPLLEWVNMLPTGRATVVQIPETDVFDDPTASTSSFPIVTWSPHAAETIVYSVGSDTGRTVIGASPGAAPVEWRGPVFSTRDSQRHMLRGVCVTDGMLMYLQHTGGIEGRAIVRHEADVPDASLSTQDAEMLATQLPPPPPQAHADDDADDTTFLLKPLSPRPRADLIPFRTVDMRRVCAHMVRDFVNYGTTGDASAPAVDDGDAVACDCIIVDDTFFARQETEFPITVLEAEAMLSERCRHGDSSPPHSARLAIHEAITRGDLALYDAAASLLAPPLATTPQNQAFMDRSFGGKLRASGRVLRSSDALDRLRLSRTGSDTPLTEKLRAAWDQGSAMSNDTETEDTDSELAATLSFSQQATSLSGRTPMVRVAQRSSLARPPFSQSQRSQHGSLGFSQRPSIGFSQRSTMSQPTPVVPWSSQATPAVSQDIRVQTPTLSQGPSVSQTVPVAPSQLSQPLFSSQSSASLPTLSQPLSQYASQTSLSRPFGAPGTPPAKRKRGF